MILLKVLFLLMVTLSSAAFSDPLHSITVHANQIYNALSLRQEMWQSVARGGAAVPVHRAADLQEPAMQDCRRLPTSGRQERLRRLATTARAGTNM